MIIAICSDITEFQKNLCLDKNWCVNFPGASWVPSFAELVEKEGFLTVSGDIALSNVRRNIWKAEDILVIQELDALHGRDLIHLGAKPAVLTGFESPLFAYPFYDKLHKIAPIFQNRILFSGAFKLFKAASGSNYPLRFPNFNAEDIRPLKPWKDREFLVMVTSNKYWNTPFRVSFLKDPRKFGGWMLEKWRNLKSPAKSMAIKNELQSKRFEAIEYFGNLNCISLYGKGWDDLNVLPLNWHKRLENILKNLNPAECENKMKTISNFKFAVCFENVSYEGYITEKIIDCFVAGTIPIYLGAPDVQKFIPKETFIDMRNFDTWDSLYSYIDGMTSQRAQEMLSAGREYLISDQGKLQSNEGFAQFIKEILLKTWLC